jgi:transposase
MMVWTPLGRHVKIGAVVSAIGGHTMNITTVGLDIAKNVFQVHGADETGVAVLRRQIRRDKVLGFFCELSPCTVAMEACGGSHYWAREIAKFGHTVRLIPPAYVKPFVKRQKNDAADAEAICEATQRPTMRYVPVKSQGAQASALLFRARDMLVRQKTQLVNAMRGHLMEFGFVFPVGPSHASRLFSAIQDIENSLPSQARQILQLLMDTCCQLEERVKELDREISARAKADTDARNLMSIPGVGPITATAITALVPHISHFQSARDFAAWLGLTPRQRSTGGKQKLGSTSKMGERTIRRLMIIGAASVVQREVRVGNEHTWLARLLGRKPRMLAIVAMANKMARIVWAILQKGEPFRAQVATA